MLRAERVGRPLMRWSVLLASLQPVWYKGGLVFSFARIGKLMSRVCQVTGKRPLVGNNVSHANNKTKKRSLPNLHSHRFWVESENRWVKLRVSCKGLRVIDKNGIDQVLAGLRARGEKV